jgi:hypothetical protein
VANTLIQAFPNTGNYILGAASIASGILLILGVKSK